MTEQWDLHRLEIPFICSAFSECLDHDRNRFYIFKICWVRLWPSGMVTVGYDKSREEDYSFSVFIISPVIMIPAGCGARATGPPATTSGATGESPGQGSRLWLYRASIWGVKYLHYQWQTFLRWIFVVVHFCYFLVPQGIYSHAVELAHRRGNSQPDLLNMKAQKDASGLHRYTKYKKIRTEITILTK